jgi:hypothetical protein
MSLPRCLSRIARAIVVAIQLAASAGIAHAHICWLYSGEPATRPQMCGLSTATTILEQHGYWHCANPVACNDAYGLAFLGFHRQFILDFDRWRLDLGIERLESWDAAPGVPIPGNDEDLSTGFTHCFTGAVDDATSRPMAAACNGCQALPANLVGDDNLDDFATLGSVGSWLECSGWHGAFHCGAAEAGADVDPDGCQSDGCNDIGTPAEAPHDPAFWMAHKKLDVVARDWQRLKAADLVIVIDRSGSMDDNCPGGNADPGETPCKLNDAKRAARRLVDLIQDDRPGSTDEHMIGLVSFAGAATAHLGGVLVPAAGAVTDNGMDETAFEAALAAIGAGGSTSIGDGISRAIDVLDTGSNPHRAILLLTDGEENVAPFIADVEGDLGDVQVCAIGYGTLFADPEDKLRTLAEDHGGVFVADANLSEDAITLEKFFVDAFGQIFDETLSEDPILVLPAGLAATTPVVTPICASDGRLTIVLSRDPATPACSLDVVVTTPDGNLVDLMDASIERGRGEGSEFVRIPLPYRGEHAGNWTAAGVRPQRVYTHGFTTDAFFDLEQGVALARREIHRLFPLGHISCLYYEDGSASGASAYATALQREVAAGNITALSVATSANDFAAQLAGNWDLVVFARQVNRTSQPYDNILAGLVCQGQRALITDFYSPAGAPNPILQCAGTLRDAPSNWSQIVGDGRLVEGVIPIANAGYAGEFSFSALPISAGEPWLVQARNEFQGGSIIGNGAACDAQTYFIATLVRGFGRVEGVPVRPRVLVGQRILATFRMTESNRPVGDWDAVAAEVALQRPGGGPVETHALYDDGTNGDQLAGNNYWSREIPVPALATGPHVLRARFTLSKDGCVIQREAEYSVVVQPEPRECARLYCPPTRLAAPGTTVGVLGCVRNMCLETDRYDVTMTDTRGWLCRVEGGDPLPVPMATFRTDSVPGGRSECFLQTQPFYVCVPIDSGENDSTTVRFEIRSVLRPSAPAMACSAVVRVSASVVDVPAPVAVERFAVRVGPVPGRAPFVFSIALPEQGHVQVELFDLSGRRVATPIARRFPAGTHRVSWNGTDDAGAGSPAGTYFYRARAGTRTASGVIIVLR